MKNTILKATKKSAKSKHFEKKLLATRDSLWPDAAHHVWSRKTYDGFTSIPRILPLMFHLLADIHEKKNPYRVYFELWSRANDLGFIEVRDEEELAYASGYTGQRAIRTWREHIDLLEDYGFIETKPKGNRRCAYILLINPYLIAAKLNSEGKVGENWWIAFADRCANTKAKIPKV